MWGVGGSSRKTIYRRVFSNTGWGLGEFADLKGVWQKMGGGLGCFELVGWGVIPQCTL